MSSAALENVRRFLQDKGFPAQHFINDQSEGFDIDLADDRYQGAVAHVLTEREQFVLYMECRHRAPDRTLAQVAEFITRVNHETLVGNFEMDYDQGAVSFKCSLDYKQAELSYNAVADAFALSMWSLDWCWPVLVQVMSGARTAKEGMEAFDEEVFDEDAVEDGETTEDE